ncbi:GGDEF domain-containing protein [Aquibium sp. LZ166]|uniref:diguanylate cyclase n=1 Tax=Aquibium pacificus TaxID=3153579 RepID=A0ABV3SIA1_9HYPH
MSQAEYILAINLLVAGLFASAFAWAATYEKVSRPARWIAAGFILGMASYGAEWLVSVAEDARFFVFASFSLSITAFAFFNAGLGRTYRQPIPWRLLAGILIVSLPLNLAIYDMPRSLFVRDFLYQAPYFLMQAVAAWIVARTPNPRSLDRALCALLVVSSLHFLGKPFLAEMFGVGDRPQNYVDTLYGVLSQSMGAVLIVAVGLMMLVILLRDVLTEVTVRSETDPLTGLLNRRGFEQRARAIGQHMAKPNLPASIVICDLDHFKSVNDRFGHAVGDKVIAAFARQLHEAVSENHIAGRIGGEEFAVILSGVDGPAARLFAEGVRSAFAATPIEGAPHGLRPTASFGVAELTRTDTLSDMLRRADLALYEAKEAGRDCVRVARPYFSGTSEDRRSHRDG